MTFSTLVSADTLAAHLDGSWAIVDCRSDLSDPALGRAQYRAGHIPGAVYASLSRDLSAVPDGRNGRHPLPSPEAFAATCGRLGIGPSTQVVAYDQDVGAYAARLWWMLRYVGHAAVAVLDGGWAAWVRGGYPVRAGDETRPPEVFTASPRPSMHVSLDEVLPLVGGKGARLVDARSPERFEGRSEPLDRVAGHIPGAVNHFYKLNVDETGAMLPPDALRRLYEPLLGGRDPEAIVMYCGSGVTACHNLLAMEHAGLHGARLYAGSWSEWSSDPDRGVEKGTGDRR